MVALMVADFPFWLGLAKQKYPSRRISAKGGILLERGFIDYLAASIRNVFVREWAEAYYTICLRYFELRIWLFILESHSPQKKIFKRKFETQWNLYISTFWYLDIYPFRTEDLSSICRCCRQNSSSQLELCEFEIEKVYYKRMTKTFFDMDLSKPYNYVSICLFYSWLSWIFAIVCSLSIKAVLLIKI